MQIITLTGNRKVAARDLPVNLNIGCGWDHREGFLNVDLNDFHEPDLVADACKLEVLPDTHFKLILAQDILEHLERSKTQIALDRWSRLLAPDGIVSIRVPSLFGMFYLLAKPENRAAEAAEKIVHLMYGTQAYTGDYHLSGFTAEILVTHFRRAGLMVARAAMRDEWMFDIDARKTDYLSSNEEYIQHTFFSILGRPVDPNALAHYATALDSGKLDRQHMEQEILGSKEFNLLESSPRYMQKHMEAI